MNSEIILPVLSINRHRMGIDGMGVTTLVGAYGCPLACKYCLNPESWDENILPKCKKMTPQQLYDELKIDDLYFVATGGGVTFGGGESLLHMEFIKAFRQICGDSWNITVETSLNVSTEKFLIALEVVDDFIVDIKDMNPEIYKSYTGQKNDRVLEHLQILVKNRTSEHVKVRVPKIPEYNTKEDLEVSVQKLQDMGFENIEVFPYVIKNKRKETKNSLKAE